jgi:competence protein ComEA
MEKVNAKYQPYLFIAYGVLVGLMASGVFWIAASPLRGEEVELLPTSTRGTLTVYVTGAVLTPGVFILPDGSRVEDAVQAAGGFAPGAEIDSINLAMPLIDGQQIDVPGIIDTSHIIVGRININTASRDELDSLPSIGTTTAQAIIDYRLEQGDFLSIQDIQHVPGIGPATYEKIKDYITVGD